MSELLDNIPAEQWYATRHEEFNNAVRKVLDRAISYQKSYYPGRDAHVDKVLKKTVEHIKVMEWLLSNDLYVTVSYDDPALISYAKEPEHKFSHAKRVKIDLTRFLMRKKCPVRIKDSYASDLTGKIFSYLPKAGEYWQEFSGADITDCYRYSLGKASCMCGENRYKQTQLYADNPDLVKMVVVSKERFVKPIDAREHYSMMRGLVWFIGDDVYIDRLYYGGEFGKLTHETLQDSVYTFLSNKYPNKKIIKRKHNGIDPDPYKPVVDFFNIKPPTNGLWPYLDSFRYGRGESIDKIQLSSSHAKYDFAIANEAGIGPKKCTSNDCTILQANTHGYCTKCVNSGKVIQCTYCHNYIGKTEARDSHINSSTKRLRKVSICSTCALTQTGHCYRCERMIHRSQLLGLNNRHYCNECYYGIFQEITDRDNMVKSHIRMGLLSASSLYQVS